MKRNYLLFAALLGFAATFTSCEKEPTQDELGVNEVAFVIGPQTKATADDGFVQKTVIGIDGCDGLYLTEAVTTLDAIYGAEPATKGAPAYTDNVASLYGTFSAVGYKGNTEYLHAADFTYSDGLWKHEYDQAGDPESIDWQGGIYFFMRMPADPACTNLNYNTDNGQITFDYTSPASAQEQNDMLFASKKMTGKDGNNVVSFHHALTGVKFATGNSVADGVKFTKVTFSNIVTSGTCSITPQSSSDCTGCAKWTLGSRGSVSQAYDGTVTSYDKNNSSFSDSFYAGGADNNLNDEACTQTFFLIPQSTQGVTMTITYEVGGKTYENTIDLGAKLNNVTWKSGELRTYTLTEHELKVDITDEIVGGTKRNVVITNTSQKVSEYVRAMVVANWFNDAGNIVAPCTLDFTQLKSGWTRKSDGFYYYTSAIESGTSLQNPFFESYTPSGAPAGAHLVMDIAVQAIDASIATDYTAAWNAVGVNF